ncbi:MAG: patatin-like phospholipase family protein [Nitrosopumilus sp.]|nr:patatin-like phospholipase family protein [Nitrosopumilus sp.]
MTNDVPKEQRALVLQGGGALGAYEVGVLKALYEKISEKDKKEGREDRPLFDIVAGTSIGAINSAILVSHVRNKASWEDSIIYLENFWKHVSSVPELTHLWLDSWYAWRKLYPNPPSREEARRYYATREFLYNGAPKVFSRPTMKPDEKFLDASNTWYQYNNSPLIESLLEFAEFPIPTSLEENQPRLLLCSVDVQESKVVTFDSYSKESKYGQDIIIKYPNGIQTEHVMASASVPVNFDYTRIKSEDQNSSDTRYFWDGGIMSNTPLRELIAKHRSYWEDKIGSDNLDETLWEIDEKDTLKIPDLEVYIIDIWPKKEKEVPLDHDGTLDRLNDLTYQDKTHFDEKVAHRVTDYISLTKKLMRLAKDKKASEEEIKTILKDTTETTRFTKGKKTCGDLLKGRFHVKVERIERKDDSHAVSRKWMDFTSDTISGLICQGYEDAQARLSV